MKEETIMHAITKGLARINGENVNTFEREINQGKTVLEVSAGTTGFKKDATRAGGSRTYIALDCVSGDFHFSPITDEEGKIAGIEIASCGNESLDAMLKALDFALDALTDQTRGIED